MSLATMIDRVPYLRRLLVVYTPWADERAFAERAQTQTRDGLEVSIAVLDGRESQRFFGVPMARRGMQPVWVRITNSGQTACRLHVVSIDPNYFSPYEAAAANHFSSSKRVLGFGVLAFFFLPLLLLVPIKLFGAWRANRKMDAFFQEQAFRLRPIPSGKSAEGFIFTPLDAGNKVVHAHLLRLEGMTEFVFNIPVAGLDADYLRRDLEDPTPPGETIDCDLPTLRQRLSEMPRATSNAKNSREGNPANLVVIGDFPTVLSAFGARWDETETITLATCWKTFRAFLVGTEYRYSPVSGLYLFGRSQDFALQRIRESINERLHLRLWTMPLRFEGKPVWVGQVSRDIGVRFTLKTWNLTTHRVDPEVDEARDYVLEDLIEAERVEMAGYVDGAGECDRLSPRHNLTGDPYFTDGKRAVAVVTGSKVAVKFIGNV